MRHPAPPPGAHQLAQDIASGIELVYEAATPDNLHQLRVAIARFKAVSRAAPPGGGKGHLHRLRRDLRWLRRSAAAARDWDVFIADAGLRRHLRRHHVRFDMAPREIAARRRNALDVLAGALHDQRCFELEGQLQALGTMPEAADGFAGATRAFAKRRRKVRRLGRHFRRLDDAGLHALRGALRQLRYTCELLQADGDPRAAHYLESLERLVQLLGSLQDAVRGAALAKTMPRGLRKPARHYYKTRARRLRRRAIGAWSDFSHCREPA